MSKQEITPKIQEIIGKDRNCGVEVYVCIKDDNKGFYVEQMQSMNTLKDRIRTIALEILDSDYLGEEIEYRDISDVSEDKNSIYVLEQTDDYKPFGLLQEARNKLQKFDMSKMRQVLGFLFRLNRNSKEFFIYQQAYVGSKLQVNGTLKVFQRDDVFEIVESDMLKIDTRGDLVILGNTILVKRVKVLQDFFNFQTFVRNQAQDVISMIEKMDILENIELLQNCQKDEKLTISKKLMKIKNSPVLQMNREDLIQKIPMVSRYKDIIHIDQGKIRASTKKDIDNIIKMLNDDYVKSELTGSDYDSTSKTLLS